MYRNDNNIAYIGRHNLKLPELSAQTVKISKAIRVSLHKFFLKD